MKRINAKGVEVTADTRIKLIAVLAGLTLAVVLTNPLVGPLAMANIVAVLGTGFMVLQAAVFGVNLVTTLAVDTETFKLSGPAKQEPRKDDGRRDERRDDRRDQNRPQNQNANRNGQPAPQGR